MNRLFMIGNTHFDPSWLWTWDEAMASIRSTFRSALERMEEDPDFIYSFSTPAVFEWIEQVDPDLFEEIRGRVREGRWDVRAEGWWLQPDCNLPSGESLIRQGLYGQRYLREKFGLTATTVFNSDSFGHSAMMPQILKKSGVDYYVFSRPSASEKALEDDLFRWTSPDGSSVTAYRVGSEGDGSYAQNLSGCMTAMLQALRGRAHDGAIVYGVTDHGGAPTKKALREIHEMQSACTNAEIRFGSTTDFFSAQNAEEVPMFRGELQPLFYGPFSNHAEVKRNNRHAEASVHRAERASMLAARIGRRRYPSDAIRQCWKDVLFNQFHDILGGTCIPEVFTDARNLHGRAMQTANEITHFALQSVCRRIQTFGDNQTSVWNLILFNLTGHSFEGPVEAEVQWAWEFPWYQGGLECVDESGRIFPCQIITEGSKIPGFRSRILFSADVPAMGWKTFMVRQTHQPANRRFDETGLQSPFRFEICEDGGDVWCFNTTEGYGKSFEAPTLVERRTVEKGALMTRVRQIWRFRSSVLTEYITQYAESEAIDYEYTVNWNEPHAVLKLIPQEPKTVDSVLAGVPAGSIRRPADGREYPAADWMVAGDRTWLLDGVTAYDTADGLRLTVVRSPIFGDLRMGELDERLDYRYMEQGAHSGRIRVLPAALSPLDAANQAEQWINRPIVVCEANHGGDLAPAGQPLALTDGAFLSAWKRAEDGDAQILRIVEMNGSARKLSIRLTDAHPFETKLHPYEIQTLRISSDGECTEVNLLEDGE